MTPPALPTSSFILLRQARRRQRRLWCPTVADFAKLLVTGVDSTNLNPVLDALAQTSVTLSGNLRTRLQDVVNSYSDILAAADATNDNDDATLSIGEVDFTNLGVVLSSDPTVKPAQVAVLADLVDIQAKTAVDSVVELNALANAVKSLLETSLVDPNADLSSTVSVAELRALGFSVGKRR